MNWKFDQKKVLRISLFVRAAFGGLSILLLLLAGGYSSNTLLLFAVLTVWIHNVLYSLERFGDRVVFFLFHAALFFFTFGRNVIECFAGNEWRGIYSDSVIRTVLMLIYLTQAFLFAGSMLYGLYEQKRTGRDKQPDEKKAKQRQDFLRALRRFSLAAALICFCFLFATELDKYLFMRGRDYIQLYSEYSPRLPGVVVSLGALAPYALCLYLATLPSKKQCLLPLFLYVASAVPVFLVGQRNRLVSNALLVFLYFVLRHYLDKPQGKIWFGKVEKIALVILIPCGLAFLSLYAQRRIGETIGGGFVGSIVGLFRSQGVTFDVICEIVDRIWDLPITNSTYTFGPVLNYLTTNFLSSALFGTAPLPPQSVEFATRGNSMQDTISYLVMGEKYLEGNGLGSSYLAELYVDFGYVGVVIFSLLLGAFLLWFAKSFGKNVWLTAFFLIAALNLFMTPRSSALGWLVPALYVPMLALFFLLGAAAWGLCRVRSRGESGSPPKEERDESA